MGLAGLDGGIKCRGFVAPVACHLSVAGLPHVVIVRESLGGLTGQVEPRSSQLADGVDAHPSPSLSPHTLSSAPPLFYIGPSQRELVVACRALKEKGLLSREKFYGTNETATYLA